MSALLSSKERKSPQNHITRRIRELCELATEKPSKRGAPGVSRKELSRALSLSKTRFSRARRSRGAKSTQKSHAPLSHLFLKIQNETKHSSRRRRETPRCSVCRRSSSSSKKERVIREREREREKVDEALFDFKQSSSIEYLV